MPVARGGFVSVLHARYYGDGSLCPVPEYLVDAAIVAAVGVVVARGRAGLYTHWPYFGTFAPYERPGRVIQYTVKVPSLTWPYYAWAKVPKVLPAERWLYFRHVKLSPGFVARYLWGDEITSNYAGGEDGLYLAGRCDLWRAVQAELSKVTKGREWGRWFVHGADGLEASPYFVNKFLSDVAALVAEGYRLGFRGFGELYAPGRYSAVVNPKTGKNVYRWVVSGFKYRRVGGSALGLGV